MWVQRRPSEWNSSIQRKSTISLLLTEWSILGWRIGPQNITPSTSIYWSSDNDYARLGWRLCADAVPTPSPPLTDVPPTPPPATPALAQMWAAASGACTVNGSCVESPNYPQNYGSSQACTLEVNLALAAPIQVESFDVESYFDYLLVNGKRYYGTSGPTGVTPLSSVTWSSDHEGTRSGWRLCAESLAPTPSAPDFWSSVSGPCTASGGCVRSPNFPGYYSLEHSCYIEIASPSVLVSVTAFHSERGGDYMMINGEEYSGSLPNFGIIDVKANIQLGLQTSP
ncbi:unnamed protein product [Prorocentrum cordatum]|uniref:CUB domain-containing protein n=1 Tax=Prorocentrum cordatum TaxID=2364126 RepID=A0ABN9V9U5_9DINO|nr:unnamed protein product [Polarella glacialis]